MKGKRKRLLPMAICSCRIVDVPPVGKEEMVRILRHKLAAFYPGSPDELYFDFVKEGEQALLFFSPRSRIDAIREKEGALPLYSTWHALTGIAVKNGAYAVPAEGKYDLYVYRDGRMGESRVVDVIPPEMEAEILSSDSPVSRNYGPLFQKKKRKNYFLPNLLLIGLIVFLPQLAFLRQIAMDEAYLSSLKEEIADLTVENAQASASQEELNSLYEQYEDLEENRPLDITLFLTELSAALGRDVEIESLVLKKGAFQMNGVGINPLGKMERFQESDYFGNVVPYQVKAIEGSSRETFSLSGVFQDE